MKKLLTLLIAVTSLLLMSSKEKQPITIFMIGDSTMANKPVEGGNVERGWGQMLQGFFNYDEVRIDNHAVNGRSSKSFITEGRWDTVMAKIKEGDYVFIQFGHNDEKIKSQDRYTKPGSTFDDNLRKFVNEARSKGANPVLLNCIARRSFFENKNAAEEDDLFGKGITLGKEGNKLVETHIIKREDGTVDNYLEAPKNVAKELNVPFIDMNAISKQVVEGEGVEASKKLFCWIPANTTAAAPKGREDNTHMSIKGARKMCRAVMPAILEAVPALKPFAVDYDLVVAKDGSGDYMTVQEAINAVPDYNGQELRIGIAPGSYYEKLIVAESKTHVTLINTSCKEEAVITYDDFASKKAELTGRNKGTSGSSSVYIYGKWFEADGITFANTASCESFATGGRGVGQAVACLVAADCVIFRKCRFLGHQDTLYTFGRKGDKGGQVGEQYRQYYEDCYIEGTVDYIFGWAVAYFNRCEIHSLSDGYLTAASTPQGQRYGYVFNECKLTAEPGVKSYLGRPWRLYAQTVFLNCKMDDCIKPEGWCAWKKDDGRDGSTTAFYAEYKCSGKGANRDERVSWGRQLNSKEYSTYQMKFVFGGSEEWIPEVTETGWSLSKIFRK